MKNMSDLSKFAEQARLSLITLLDNIKANIDDQMDAKSTRLWAKIEYERSIKLTDSQYPNYIKRASHSYVAQLLKSHTHLSEVFSEIENLCGDNMKCKIAAVAYIEKLQAINHIYANIGTDYNKAMNACAAITTQEHHTFGSVMTCMENHLQLQRRVADLEGYYRKITDFTPIENEITELNSAPDASEIAEQCTAQEECYDPGVCEAPEECYEPGICEAPVECDNPHFDEASILSDIYHQIASGGLNGITHGFMRGLRSLMAKNHVEPIKMETYYYLSMSLLNLLKNEYEHGETISFAENCLQSITATTILIGMNTLHTKLNNMAIHSHGYIKPLLEATSETLDMSLFAYNATTKGIAYVGASMLFGGLTKKVVEAVGSRLLKQPQLERTQPAQNHIGNRYDTISAQAERIFLKR